MLDLMKQLLDGALMEQGVWVDVMFGGKPVFLNGDRTLQAKVKVRSRQSRALRDARLELQKSMAAATRASPVDPNDPVAETVQQAATVRASVATNFSALAVAFLNFDSTKPGEEIKPSPSELQGYADDPTWEWMTDLVWLASGDLTRFSPVPAQPAPIEKAS